MKRSTYSDTLRVIISGEPTTPEEKQAVVLAAECDKLVGAIESDSKIVLSKLNAVIESVNSLGAGYCPGGGMVHYGTIVFNANELIDRRNRLHQTLTAMSGNYEPDKWHLFCNAWIQKQHE